MNDCASVGMTAEEWRVSWGRPPGHGGGGVDIDVRGLRGLTGLRKAEIARVLGMSRSWWDQYEEYGRRPTAVTARRMVEGVMAYLVERGL